MSFLLLFLLLLPFGNPERIRCHENADGEADAGKDECLDEGEDEDEDWDDDDDDEEEEEQKGGDDDDVDEDR